MRPAGITLTVILVFTTTVVLRQHRTISGCMASSLTSLSSLILRRKRCSAGRRWKNVRPQPFMTMARLASFDMYYPDLTPYIYCESASSDDVLNIGWLDIQHPFPERKHPKHCWMRYLKDVCIPPSRCEVSIGVTFATLPTNP